MRTHSTSVAQILAIVSLLAAVGCAGTSPTAPTSMPIRITATRPLVLSGQSNAVNLAPFLRAVYPLQVEAVAENGRPISTWNDGSTLWATLVPALHQPLQAFVWWQGESDRDTAGYLEAERGLITRVRAENGDQQLLVIVVRILNLPQNAGVRALQEAVVASDVNAVLVSSDGPGFQDGTGDHLTPIGYQAVAQRILDALR